MLPGIGIGIGFVFLNCFTLGGGNPPPGEKRQKNKANANANANAWQHLFFRCSRQICIYYLNLLHLFCVCSMAVLPLSHLS